MIIRYFLFTVVSVFLSGCVVSGSTALKNHDYRTAIDLENKVILESSSFEDKADAHKKLCISYYNTQQFSESLMNCNEYLKFNNNDPDVYETIGLVNWSLGEKEKAIEQFYKSINANPEKSNAYYDLNEKLGLMQRHNERIKAFREYYNRNQKNGWIKVLLIRSYIGANDIDNVRNLLNDDRKAYYYYYSHFEAAVTKNFDLALSLLDESLQRYSDKSLRFSKTVIEGRKKRVENERKLFVHWMDYLREIQRDGDYLNWREPPFETFKKRFEYRHNT